MYKQIPHRLAYLLSLLMVLPCIPIHSEESLPLPVQRSFVGVDTNNQPAPVEFGYTSYQASFLTAKSASISQSENGVLIEVQELGKAVTPGVVLTFTGLTSKTIEVTTLLDLNGITVGVFPPRYVTPNQKDTYPILGKAGDKFGIRVSTDDGTRFITAQIDGATPPPPPPIDHPPPPTTDLTSLTKLVNASVLTIGDTVTQAAIKAELSKLVASFPNDLSLAKVELKNSISNGLLNSMPQLKPPYKDWSGGFRVPIDKEITKLAPTSAEQLKAIVEAIIKGM